MFFSSRSNKPYVCYALRHFNCVKRGAVVCFAEKETQRGERTYVLSGEDAGRRSGRMFLFLPSLPRHPALRFSRPATCRAIHCCPLAPIHSPFPALSRCSNRTVGCPATRLFVHFEHQHLASGHAAAHPRICASSSCRHLPIIHRRQPRRRPPVGTSPATTIHPSAPAPPRPPVGACPATAFRPALSYTAGS